MSAPCLSSVMSTPPEPPRSPRPGRTIIAAAAAFVAALVLAGIVGVVIVANSGSDDAASPVPDITQRPITLRSAAPTTVAPVVAGGCESAPLGVLVTINNALTSPGVLTETAMVTDAEGRQWIGANITTHDGRRVSSADVWVVNGNIIYALSGGARGNSTLHDGRHLLGLSAGDDTGIAVQDCVTGQH